MKAEISIDDSVATQLKEVAAASHISFGQAVEKAIAAGLPYLRVTSNGSVSREARLDAANAALRKSDEEMEIERYRRAGG